MRVHLDRAVVCAVLVSVMLSEPVRAAFTPINPPVGEESHQDIFSVIYGGTFLPAGPLGLDYSNGVITATRIDDYLDPEPSIFQTPRLVGDPGTDDQIWQADFRYASAEAKFAVYKQNFGYFEGVAEADAAAYIKLFDQTGWGYSVGGEAVLSDLQNKQLRWARGGEDRVVSSLMSDNLDGMDHMVTYEISFSADQTQNAVRTWLLFWEDKYFGEHLADFDFNDLVVEVNAAVNEASTPEPASMGLALAGAMLAMTRRAGRS